MKTDDVTTIYGGLHIDVLRNDGGPERVFVRQLPLRLVPRYLELKVGCNDQGVIELCLGRSVDWGKEHANSHAADAFTPEAQEQLLELADKLNFTTGLRWIERNKASREKLTPLLKALHGLQAEMMAPGMERMMASLLSVLTPVLHSASLSTPSSTSPAPSSSSSSAATPTASGSTP